MICVICVICEICEKENLKIGRCKHSELIRECQYCKEIKMNPIKVEAAFTIVNGRVLGSTLNFLTEFSLLKLILNAVNLNLEIIKSA